ncbi:MAG TPA: SHD1 domain-containing protein [Candidatus Anammoximicrobium sp.]|nr:SHD1 domain-containing protein [Candidatus Anammoximicrobium sp.]
MGELRTWWDSTRTFSGEAEFVSLFGGKEVFLKTTTGPIIHVPLYWFSKEDQAYVFQQVVEENKKSHSARLPYADITSAATSLPPGAGPPRTVFGTRVAADCPWQRFLPECDILCDTSYQYHPADVETATDTGSALKLSNGTFLWPSRLKLLERILEPYDSSEARTVIVDGLTRLWLEYDDVDHVIRFEPPRHLWGLQAGRLVSVEGCLWLTHQPPEAALRIVYHGERAIRAESITIVTDTARWESRDVAFARHKIDKHDVLEIAHLGLAEPGIFSLATKIAQAEKAVVRFRGRFHSDLVVTEDMKGDLRAILGALVALGLETDVVP